MSGIAIAPGFLHDPRPDGLDHEPAWRVLLPRFAAAAGMVIGVAALIGWVFEIESLKSILPRFSSLKVNAAVAVLLVSSALWLVTHPTHRPWADRLAFALTAGAGLVGVLTLWQYIAGHDLGIDQLLWPERAASEYTGVPGRMAPQTAAAVSLLAVALLIKQRLRIRARRHASPGEACAVASAVIASVPLVGYLYGILSATRIAGATAMSLNASLAVITLATGVIALPPRGAFMDRLVSGGPGGIVARRGIVAMPLMLLLLGWLRKTGQDLGLFDAELGLTILIVGAAVLLAAGLIVLAGRLDIASAAERALAGRLRQLSMAVEQSPVSIVITDPRGGIEYVNPHFTSVTGQAAEEVRGKDLRALSSDPAAAPPYGSLETLGPGETWEGEIQARKANGDPYWEHVTIAPLSGARGTVAGYVAVKQDLTERRKAQADQERLAAQLLQAQKMESVGRLAGGVAHDFNNLITVIATTAELRLGELPEGDPVRGDLALIRETSERAASLTRQLLAFSRQQVFEPRVVDVNALLAGTERMLHRLIGEDVDLRVKPGRAVGNVLVDPHQLEQVVVNMAVNSRDAMPRGGTLTIETANVTLDESYASDHPEVVPGPYVVLSVTDTGTGMDKATLERVFDPFFTTKELGRGTGLGLASVYGIVKQSGGSIWAYSEPGRGSTFKVYLPRVFEPAQVEATTPTPTESRGHETILLVEDESALLAVTRRILERAGYTVLTAARPEDAMRALSSHEGPVHALITDVVLPGMRGPDLAERLREARPDMRVLFMSGYTANAIVHQGVLDEGTNFLNKPFAATELTAKVRQILDAPAA